MKQQSNFQKNVKKFRALVLVFIVLCAGCSKDDDTVIVTNEAASLELLSGGDQSDFTGRTLTSPVVIVVKDQDGNPFGGVTVNFAVSEGAVSAQTLQTNIDGEVFVDWTLGNTLGVQTLTVSSFIAGGVPLGDSPISVTATALDPCQSEINPTNLSIGPDAGTVTNSQIAIAESFVISDVNVIINLTHTWNTDLDIFLIAPSGLVIELSSDNGGAGNDYLQTIFDDDAEVSIIDGESPFTGRFMPEESLSAFNGSNAQGEWTLTIIDDQNQDGGSLLDWTIELCQ